MSLLGKMSLDLGINQSFISRVARRSDHYYRMYKINKAGGKNKRKIYHPSPTLKVFQYWLVRNVFSKFPISEFTYAYEKGCSIKKNAYSHKDSSHILHMDIEKFFESINDTHLFELFSNNKDISEELLLTENDLELINKICLYDGHLTIGSVCAPMISNCVMCNFDYNLREILNDNIIYTRYADDMVFSSKEFIEESLIEIVSMLLREHGFKPNIEKTYFMSENGRRQVTGLIIDHGNVYIGLNRKKDIKRMIYRKLKHGEGNSTQILGHLDFLKDIEPEYYKTLVKKYSKFAGFDLIQFLKKSPSIQEVAATLIKT